MKKRIQNKTKFDIGRTLPTSSTASASTKPAAPQARQPGKSTPPLPEPPSKQPWGWKKRITAGSVGLLAAILIFALIIFTWDARNISSASKKMFGSGNIFSLLNSSSLTTDPNTGRVNLLIAGYSADDPGHAGATLTDSILLISMSPSKHTGYMLSIPRDLYVNIPSFGYGKINEAYKDGGMDLLKQVVEKDFDTKVGYWALVDYTAVRDIVNAIGGINVTINSPELCLNQEPARHLNGGSHC